MIYIIGDLHLKHKQPFFNAQKKLLTVLQEKYNNDILIFTGDIFDNSSPKWEVFSLFKEFLLKRNNSTYLVTGNHDYSKLKGNVLQPFSLLPDVYVIDTISLHTIQNHKILFVPYLYNNDYTLQNSVHNVIVICHVTPEKYQFSNEGVVFTNVFNSKIIYGHYHIQQKVYTDNNHNEHYIIGVPIETRYKENQSHKLFEITDTSEIITIDLPVFLQYIDIEYGYLPDINSECEYILNIKNAPSFDAVYSLYSKYYIREEGIELQKTSKQNTIYTDINKSFNQLNLVEKFSLFIKEKELQLDKGVQDLCFSLLLKIG